VLKRLLTIIVCNLAIFVFGTGFVLGPLLQDIAVEFHRPLEITALLVGYNFAASLVTPPFAGYLADRYGKKPAVAHRLGRGRSVILSFRDSFILPIVILATVLGGGMGGALEGLCGAIIVDIDPEESNRNLTLLQVSFAVGIILALFASIWLRDAGIGLARSLHLDGYRNGNNLAAGAAHPGSTGSARGVDIAADCAARDKRPIFQLMALSLWLYVGVELSLSTWIRPMLEQRGFTPETGLMGVVLFWVPWH